MNGYARLALPSTRVVRDGLSDGAGWELPHVKTADKGDLEVATAGHIRVTPEQLGAIAGQLNAGAANIEQINQQLQGQVAPLGSDWAGVAQARFHELWAEWQRSSQGIQHALQGISQLMTQASANYADTEAAIASTFQR